MKKLLHLFEERPLNPLETILAVSTAFMSGLVLGLLLSPKGNRSYGCNNGNNSGNYCGLEKENKDNIKK